MAAGPFDNNADLASFLGISAEEICHGAQGVKVEEDGVKKRSIFDGTSNGNIPRIRKNHRKKRECPAAGALRHALKLEHRGLNRAFVVMKVDRKKAHRRLKTARKDWRYQTAVVQSRRFVNTCGTYAIATAQFYWGRLVGLIHRIFLIIEIPIWLFTYVDDLLFLLLAETKWVDAAAAVLFLEILGFQINRAKFCIWHSLRWIGLQADMLKATIWPTDDKVRFLLEFLGCSWE